jgi:glycosyltransferase involved in cell wall biosynthesis
MSTGAFEVVILNDHAAITGGSASVAIASALELAARGVKVTFFSCVGPVAPELRGVKNLDVICLEQEEIAKNPNRLQAFAGGWRNARAVRALRALLATRSPEHTIVHVHGWMKALSPFALAAVTRLGFRLVVTLHDFFITCPNGGFFDHGANVICRRQPLSLSCWNCHCDRRSHAHKLWRNVRTVLQNRVLGIPARVAHYIAVSQFSLDVMRPHLPPDVKATVVRNPLTTSERQEPARVEQNREVVFVGRFENEKGVRLFAEAARRAGVAATLVGDGALMPELRARFPQMRFTGWLNRGGIREVVRRSRALVFPPLWYETLGLVVIEAAAEGVPAIVADRCAATDYIRAGENGLHFTQGSVESLARQMSAVVRSDGLAGRLGRAAYEWYWQQPWTAERHVTDLLRVYREVAGTAVSAAENEEVWHERTGRIGTRS